MDNRKNISFGTRRGKSVSGLLHVEVPGAIVNIRTGLRNVQGQEVTNVEVLADQYAGEPSWTIPTMFGGSARSIGLTVVQGDKITRIDETNIPDITDLSQLIKSFQARYPKGYVHTTFVSGNFTSGRIDIGLESIHSLDAVIYFADINQALSELRKYYEHGTASA